MARKICLFMFEGQNDEIALAKPLENWHKSRTSATEKNIRFDFTKGDITSDFKVKNIANEVTKHVKHYCSKNSIEKTDICEVVFLFDMDGAYVPVDVIKQSSDAQEIFYGERELLHKNPDKLKSTHEHKKVHLNRLIALDKVYGNIPFSVYFVSCNLDHIICKDANSTQKRKNAIQFEATYAESADDFVSFFCDPALTLGETYGASWDAIRCGLTSLHRHSNMNVFLSG